jgi:hypothetical protein
MHPNAVHHKLSIQLTETEARSDARLDRLESKLDLILIAAGLAVEPPGPTSQDIEVLDRDGRPLGRADLAIEPPRIGDARER